MLDNNTDANTTITTTTTNNGNNPSQNYQPLRLQRQQLVITL
jgi:hypothetical protein